MPKERSRNIIKFLSRYLERGFMIASIAQLRMFPSVQRHASVCESVMFNEFSPQFMFLNYGIKCG